MKVTSKLPPGSTMDWPMGDRLPNAPLPLMLTGEAAPSRRCAFGTGEGLTAAFVVVHKGRIIAERYGNGRTETCRSRAGRWERVSPARCRSLINEGAFKLEDPAPVPEWRKTPGTPGQDPIMDVMRMSSGLRFSRGSPEDSAGYHDHDLIYSGRSTPSSSRSLGRCSSSRTRLGGTATSIR